MNLKRPIGATLLILFVLSVVLFVWGFTTLYELGENKTKVNAETLLKVSLQGFNVCMLLLFAAIYIG
ncbi:hypothetical protein QR680_016676 [Steinernema hermaphroditum]|uniref:Uncharacterized protein n=1 Tax=Steinernema hermaphroditum TaxID=289476 RepID=A0AA39HBY0_9BILA|nr:hypothetical protein QR680_016676 [Steinernema hermaphroditum]